MCIKLYGNTKINKWKILKNTYELITTLFLQDFNQMRIKNPVKHLR